MLIDYTYGATIVAAGPVRCLKLNRATLHALMLDDAGLAEHLTGKITQRLNRVAAELRAIDPDLDQDEALPGYVVDGSDRDGAVAQPH